MTQGRAGRIRRIVGVRRQMQRAAEWTLHDLRRREQGLRLSQHEVLSAFGRDDALLAALAPVLSRRLSSLAAQADALAAAGDRKAEHVLEETGRLRHAERLERAVAGEVERASHRSDLEDLVDVLAGGDARAMFR